jgi:hypothetical protein
LTACLPGVDYPAHDKVIVVTRCGRICLGRNFSTVFASQAVGIKEAPTIFGWLLLWTMIWDTLIWRLGC